MNRYSLCRDKQTDREKQFFREKQLHTDIKNQEDPTMNQTRLSLAVQLKKPSVWIRSLTNHPREDFLFAVLLLDCVDPQEKLDYDVDRLLWMNKWENR